MSDDSRFDVSRRDRRPVVSASAEIDDARCVIEVATLAILLNLALMFDMKASTGLPSVTGTTQLPSPKVPGDSCSPTGSVRNRPAVVRLSSETSETPRDSQGVEEAAKSVLPSAMRSTRNQYRRSDLSALLSHVGIRLLGVVALCVSLPSPVPGRPSCLGEKPRGAETLMSAVEIVMFEKR